METAPFLEHIFEAVSSGVIGVDQNGCIVRANPAALKVLGLEQQDILGADLETLLPVLGGLVKKALESGQPEKGRHIEEAAAYMVATINPIMVEDRVSGAVCNFVSIQEMEESARRLKSYGLLNEQLNAIFELSSDGIWVTDVKGIVLRINRASEILCGVKAEDVVGKNIRAIQEEGLIDHSATLRVLTTKRRVNLLQYVSRTQKHLLLTGTPLFDENGEISLVVVNERDLTQLNAVKEQLEQTRMVKEKFEDELAELSMRELREERFIAESPQMKQVLRTASKLARLEASNILILGESGTGKGLLAKFIHNNGNRRSKPFIQINCAALPENLLEAELFGYEKGAFTGAHERGKAGLFELAQDGTLFLDEIGESPISAQAKLLKYLDDHEVLRLGGTKPTLVDCTIIAATNQDLEAKVKTGEFRQDLFYRLNAFTLRIPPLCERSEDIFELAAYFLETYNKRYDLTRRISPEAMALLQAYHFPGNVRQLKSILKTAAVMSERDLIDEHLEESLKLAAAKRPVPRLPEPRSTNLSMEMNKLEKALLHKAMRHCRTTRDMAGFLGISQPSVVRKMKRHGLSRS